MSDVSVIIPVYITNTYQTEWVFEAIQSAVDNKASEIIVIDDCSPVDVIWTFSRYDNVRIIVHDVQRGAGAARNTGIAAATNDWIVCLDSDDRLESGALDVLWERRCDHGVVYGDVQFFGDKSGYQQMHDYSVERLLRLDGLLPVTALFPKWAWQRVGGFDESLEGLEDVEFWIRLATLGVCGVRVPKLILHYRKHGQSRQAGLETNNNEKLRDVHVRIKDRHRTVGINSMPCKTCPGQGAGISGVVYMTDNFNDPVLLRYQGGMLGAFTVIARPSGNKYQVPGKVGGSFPIERTDLEWFINQSLGGVPLYFVDEKIVQQSVPPQAEVIAHNLTIPVESQVPRISKMNAEDAIAEIAKLDNLPDLFVLQADERTRGDKARKTVLEAIETRINTIE